MARGWESKSVESQQEARVDRPRGPAAPPPSRQAAEAAARRQTLELALARARADLVSARVPAHRRMLEQAIEALVAQLRNDHDS
jgi:hypothetical protein